MGEGAELTHGQCQCQDVQAADPRNMGATRAFICSKSVLLCFSVSVLTVTDSFHIVR